MKQLEKMQTNKQTKTNRTSENAPLWYRFQRKVRQTSVVGIAFKGLLDKNSVGNVEAKELISMTHGHEL